MLVKVFEAEEMSAALKMVKETLGPDALILSTRTLRKGGMGVFGKPMLEVTAAVESPALAPTPQVTAARAAKPSPVRTDGGEEDLDYRELWRRSAVVESTGITSRSAVGAARDEAGESLAAVRAELDELKSMLQQVTRTAQPVREERESGFAQAYALARETDGLQRLLSELGRWGIEAEVAEAIVRCTQGKLTPGEISDVRKLQRFLQESLGAMVSVTGSLFNRTNRQQRIALVGPTGVGKTTTLAKLAADYLTHHDGKVALVTIDTYRIAAVEQLKVYGEILCLPVEVIFTPADLQSAFARHADKDLILIDTAGRSPRDDQRLDELAAFLGQDSGISNHLVLAATTRNRELQEAVQRFGRLPIDSLIFTKLDECEERGVLLNVPVHRKLPVSYLTNGQRVPEDLLVARPGTIADYVMGHV